MDYTTRPYVLERDTGEYSRPFLEYTFGKHAEWRTLAQEYEVVHRGRPSEWMPFIRFPVVPPGTLAPSLTVTGIEITIGLGEWHCHRGIDPTTAENIGVERLEEWSQLWDRVERGEAPASERAAYIYDFALATLEALLDERLVLVNEYSDGRYVGGGLRSAGDIDSIAREGTRGAASYMGSLYPERTKDVGAGRVIEIASYRGTHDRRIGM